MESCLGTAWIHFYVYVYVYSTAQRYNLHKHSTSVSRAWPLRPVVGIVSFATVAGSNLIWLILYGFIWLNFSDFIQLAGPNLIWLTSYDLIQLIVSDLIRLAVFDWIWVRFFTLIQLIFNAFIFDSSHVMLVPFLSCFRESHVGQGVFKKSNIEIVDYSTVLINQIDFGENTLNFSKNDRREISKRTNHIPSLIQWQTSDKK